MVAAVDVTAEKATKAAQQARRKANKHKVASVTSRATATALNEVHAAEMATVALREADIAAQLAATRKQLARSNLLLQQTGDGHAQAVCTVTNLKGQVDSLGEIRRGEQAQQTRLAAQHEQLLMQFDTQAARLATLEGQVAHQASGLTQMQAAPAAPATPVRSHVGQPVLACHATAICFNCSKKGHVRANCPEQKSGRGGPSGRGCNFCRALGHKWAACPQRPQHWDPTALGSSRGRRRTGSTPRPGLPR